MKLLITHDSLLLQRTFQCVANPAKDPRLQLAGVHVDAEKGWVVATDGYRMAQYRIEPATDAAAAIAAWQEAHGRRALTFAPFRISTRRDSGPVYLDLDPARGDIFAEQEGVRTLVDTTPGEIPYPDFGFISAWGPRWATSPKGCNILLVNPDLLRPFRDLDGGVAIEFPDPGISFKALRVSGYPGLLGTVMPMRF